MNTAGHRSSPDPIIPGTRWGSTAVVPKTETAIGYTALLRDLGVKGYTPVHQTVLTAAATRRGRPSSDDALGRTTAVLGGATAAPRTTITDHLFSAIRYDGVDLEALRLAFNTLDPKELTEEIRAAPQAIPARRAWYLYETITGKTLDVASDSRSKYVPLFDPERYVTCEHARSTRHGVIVNGLGDVGRLCATIRRSAAWEAAVAEHPLQARDRLAAELDATAEERINTFLATRESHSTYEIEGESTTPKDDQLFYALLKEFTAVDQPPISHEVLHHLQKTLLAGSVGKQVGKYRTHQIWVGDRVGDRAVPHHIAPKAEDVPSYMDAFCAVAAQLTSASRVSRSGAEDTGRDIPVLDPIATAAVTSGLLAYLHPFDDGNGRVGRLLLQRPLTSHDVGRRLFVPISAAIARKKNAYYDSLDAWSKPLLNRITYDQHQGGVTVTNDTRDLYRYPDITRYAGFIAEACTEAVNKDLLDERRTLAVYDAVNPLLLKAGLDEKKAQLYFKLAYQNGGRLGKRKTRFFPTLAEGDLTSLANAIARAAKQEGLTLPKRHEPVPESSAP